MIKQEIINFESTRNKRFKFQSSTTPTPPPPNSKVYSQSFDFIVVVKNKSNRVIWGTLLGILWEKVFYPLLKLGAVSWMPDSKATSLESKATAQNNNIHSLAL